MGRVEPATIKGMYVGYAMILAAIGPICQLIGSQLFGIGPVGFSYHPPLMSAIIAAAVGYGLGLVGIAFHRLKMYPARPRSPNRSGGAPPPPPIGPSWPV